MGALSRFLQEVFSKKETKEAVRPDPLEQAPVKPQESAPAAEQAPQGEIKPVETPSPDEAPTQQTTPAKPTGSPETEPPAAPAPDAEAEKLKGITDRAFGDAEPTPAPKKPIFNPDRIQADDDIKSLLDETAAAFPDEFAAFTRGSQKLDDIEERALAQMFNTTPAGIRELRALKAEEFTKAGFTMMNMATEIKTLSQKVASPEGSELDAAKLRMLMEDFALTTMHVKGMQTETARTLSAMRISKRATAEATEQVADVVKQFGGMGLSKRVAQMLAEIDTSTPTGMAQFGKAVHESRKVTLGDMFWEVYYNVQLLSSPQTHVVNTLSSLGVYGLRIPELLGAYAAGNVRNMFTNGEAGIAMREIMAFTADTSVISDAVTRAWQALKTGEPSDLATKFDPQMRRRAITASNVRDVIDEGTLSKYATEVLPNLLRDGHWTQKGFDALADYTVRGPSRVMLTSDELNKGLFYSSVLKMQATREAIEEGLTGDAMALAIKDKLADPDTLMPGAAKMAQQWALEGTFQQPLTGTAELLQKMVFNKPDDTLASVGQALLLRFNMPFVRTPVNLLKYAMERSYIPGSDTIAGELIGAAVPIPAAVLLPSFRAAIKAGGREADLAISKMAIGTALSYTLFNSVLSDYITGGGPQDRSLKKQWRELGHQPYALVIPADSALGKSIGLAKDYSISYKRNDPLSMIIGIQADARDVAGYASAEERNLLGMTMVAAMYRNLHDRTFLQNFGSFMDALSDLGGDKASLKQLERHYAQIAGSLSPTAGAGVAWLGRQLDEDERTFKDTGSDTRAQLQSKRGPREPADEGFMEIIAFADQVINRIKARSPGMGSDLPDRLNFWGEPIKGPRGFFFDMFPFYKEQLKFKTSEIEALGMNPTRWTGHPARELGAANFVKFIDAAGPEGEFIRLGWGPGNHGYSIKGVPMTPTEYHSHVKNINEIRPSSGALVVDGVPILDYSGMKLRDAMTAVMKTPEYFMASDSTEQGAKGTKISIIQRLLTDYRNDIDRDDDIGLGGAQLRTFFQHPNLRERVIQADRILTPPEKILERRGLLN